jgi:hypothetical protein
MRQTMPHVYKMSKHPKDKRYKKGKKTAKKKRLKSEMHTKCLKKI